MEKNWNEELEKCKDPVYFFENYWIVDGQKPSPQAVDNLREFLKEKPKGWSPQIRHTRRGDM